MGAALICYLCTKYFIFSLAPVQGNTHLRIRPSTLIRLITPETGSISKQPAWALAIGSSLGYMSCNNSWWEIIIGLQSMLSIPPLTLAFQPWLIRRQNVCNNMLYTHYSSNVLKLFRIPKEYPLLPTTYLGLWKSHMQLS